MQTWFIWVALIAFSICFYAFLRGRWPERLVALALTGEFAFHQLMNVVGRSPPFAAVTGEQFLPNMLLLMMFVIIAVYANRTWTIALAALQLLRSTSQIIVLISSDGGQLAYWSMSQLPLAGELLLLFCGTLAVERRNRLQFFARDWR